MPVTTAAAAVHITPGLVMLRARTQPHVLTVFSGPEDILGSRQAQIKAPEELADRVAGAGGRCDGGLILRRVRCDHSSVSHPHGYAYHRGFHIVQAFLNFATHNTVESLQSLFVTRMPLRFFCI
jgi:hypothetical protein